MPVGFLLEIQTGDDGSLCYEPICRFAENDHQEKHKTGFVIDGDIFSGTDREKTHDGEFR